MNTLNNTEISNGFVFGTKAETLHRLLPHLKTAIIPEVYFFTIEEWRLSSNSVLASITEKFGNSLIAVRSSALAEDGALDSMAGAFHSVLNVNGGDLIDINAAIENTISSMTTNPRDQILIQPMIDSVAVSGVIMTYDMVHGSPYYCIEYDDESGRTDNITSGNGVHKGLFVYRNADDGIIISSRVSAFLKLARELEAICRCAALDIEFGMDTNGQLYLFQVRRISLARNWHPVTERRAKRQLSHIEEFIKNCSTPIDGVLGERTILAIMPDWNPAEIISTTPRPLAASLYRELITRGVWCKAREFMGCRPLGDADLMVLINNHPYIDVRYSFNSFLPANLSDRIGEKLIEAWLNRLQEFPEYHDKIEFEVVTTCMDFCFEQDFKDRYPSILSSDEFSYYRTALTDLTRACLKSGELNTLDNALLLAEELKNSHKTIIGIETGYSNLAKANSLFNRCRELGTFSFAVVARHAFLAEAILRSAVRRGALTKARLDSFKRSIETITGHMLQDYTKVSLGELSKEAFNKLYGHLRPGTYEITSLRYDERDDLFNDYMPSPTTKAGKPFKLSQHESEAIEILLKESGLDVVTPTELMNYASKAIKAREYVKFIFTRSLSDGLSEIMLWGAHYGLSRDDLSYISWPELRNSLSQPIMDDVDRHYLDKADLARKSLSEAHAVKLGHILYDVQDIYAATVNRSVPNFVGCGGANGQVIVLESNTPTSIIIKDHIVCIENADPGFDWIFTKNPAALITCYGGANSHMAVRCAEFGIPAAIGCGDQLYRHITEASKVELNCEEKILRPLYVG